MLSESCAEKGGTLVVSDTDVYIKDEYQQFAFSLK